MTLTCVCPMSCQSAQCGEIRCPLTCPALPAYNAYLATKNKVEKVMSEEQLRRKK